MEECALEKETPDGDARKKLTLYKQEQGYKATRLQENKQTGNGLELSYFATEIG